MNSYDNYITWFYNFDTAFNSLIFFPKDCTLTAFYEAVVVACHNYVH